MAMFVKHNRKVWDLSLERDHSGTAWCATAKTAAGAEMCAHGGEFKVFNSFKSPFRKSRCYKPLHFIRCFAKAGGRHHPEMKAAEFIP